MLVLTSRAPKELFILPAPSTWPVFNFVAFQPLFWPTTHRNFFANAINHHFAKSNSHLILHFSDSLWPHEPPQAPSSLGLPRQESRVGATLSPLLDLVSLVPQLTISSFLNILSVSSDHNFLSPSNIIFIFFAFFFLMSIYNVWITRSWPQDFIHLVTEVELWIPHDPNQVKQSQGLSRTPT